MLSDIATFDRYRSKYKEQLLKHKETNCCGSEENCEECIRLN